MTRVILLVLALAALAGCGKRGNPEPRGPADKVTYPRSYPTH